ncbi:MAG: hypothetical protein KDE32_10040 [Novosphingobium sp.]|nr:hypothetical protein [Novosphingobium sp.]
MIRATKSQAAILGLGLVLVVAIKNCSLSGRDDAANLDSEPVRIEFSNYQDAPSEKAGATLDDPSSSGTHRTDDAAHSIYIEQCASAFRSGEAPLPVDISDADISKLCAATAATEGF